MEDLHNRIIHELNEQGFSAQLKDKDISVTVPISDYEVELFCNLGPHFPYEFPSIYISREMWETLPSMPHKYTNGSICTFDKNIAIPNYSKPVELAVETISKAVNILIDGIGGTNKLDYMDEFLDYWKTRDHEPMQFFVDDLSKPCQLSYIKNNNGVIIGNDIDKLVDIHIATLGDAIKESVKGFLIPTTGNKSRIIPKTDLDFLKLAKENSIYWNQLNNFIQQHINSISFFVVIAENNKEGEKLYGWKFNGPGIPHGFRKGHVNLTIAFNKSNNPGKAIVINNCSQSRIYTRGGDGRDVVIKRVCTIGCGSLGSYILEALMNCGTESFILVDNDILTYDNIARHYAGYCYVGLPKVDAIKTKLRLHNPNIKCDAIFSNAFDFLKKQSTDINNCDLLVVAVAYTPLEHYIIEMVNSGTITVPTLIIWTEPYAIAGHAILINTSMGIFDELFDSDTKEYQYGVVRNPEQFNKRESGCQSSYMPYSAFSVKTMVFRILEPCIKNYIGNGKNYRFTWIGELSHARMKGIRISDYYADVDDYSLEIERVY